VTPADLRSAALDSALVDDGPSPEAFALAGVADAHDDVTDGAADPLVASLLAVGCLGSSADGLHPSAWTPGTDDPLVVAGAAVAVRTRDVPVARAAELADCSVLALRTALE
jgi:hypothetical protein